MSINGLGLYQAQDYEVQNQNRVNENNVSVFDDEFATDVSMQTDAVGEKKVIGLMTIGVKVNIAIYANSSTEQVPIIKVGNDEIRVKDVNPNNATKIEMFALMSYMDDKGLTGNEGIKSYSKMMAFAMQAEYNGYCSGISDDNVASTLKQDWLGIIDNAKETFLKNSQTYKQGLECDKMINNLMEWTEKFVNTNLKMLDSMIQGAKHVPIEVSEIGMVRTEHGIKKIVTAQSSEDGKEYLTYFTKESIVCKSTEETDKTMWNMKITEEQYELVNNYFEKYEASQGGEVEWYSGDDLGMVSSKGFWLGFFEGAEVAEDTDTMAEMLCSESTSCVCPSSDESKGEIRYITWYSDKGIFCRKAGQTEGFEWSILYEDKEQYDKVMEFIKQLSNDEDLRFTANKNFWNEFLIGETDVEKLKDMWMS